MSILIDDTTRVTRQGSAGESGTFHTGHAVAHRARKVVAAVRV